MVHRMVYNLEMCWFFMMIQYLEVLKRASY